MNFTDLYTIIEKRKKEKPKGSFVATLMEKGVNNILQKIGEEAVEVIIAGKNKSKKRIIEEVSDLFFMVCIFLSFVNIKPEEIFTELEKRNKK